MDMLKKSSTQSLFYSRYKILAATVRKVSRNENNNAVYTKLQLINIIITKWKCTPSIFIIHFKYKFAFCNCFSCVIVELNYILP